MKDVFKARLKKITETATERSMTETRERLRVASEVRDNIGQLILLARINLDVLTDEKTPEGYESVLEEARNLLDQAISGIRTLFSNSFPLLLAENGLESSLSHLCRQMEQNAGLRVAFSDDENEKPLSDLSRSTIYHVARSILHTAAKHTENGIARLATGLVGNMFRLEIEVKGVSHEPFTSRKPGKLDIRQCIQRLGGNMSVILINENEVCITIRAPLATPGLHENSMDGAFRFHNATELHETLDQ